MKRTKKRILKELREIAKTLPEVEYAVNGSVEPLGTSLIAAGYTEHEGEPIDPSKRYGIRNNEGLGTRLVNHYKQLKKAYNAKCERGVEDYVNNLADKFKKDEEE